MRDLSLLAISSALSAGLDAMGLTVLGWLLSFALALCYDAHWGAERGKEHCAAEFNTFFPERENVQNSAERSRQNERVYHTEGVENS